MVNDDECRAAGVDPEEVRKLDRRLAKVGSDAHRLGVSMFGGSGSLTIRSNGGLILASVVGPGHWDGGDGAEQVGTDGLTYGESR